MKNNIADFDYDKIKDMEYDPNDIREFFKKYTNKK